MASYVIKQGDTLTSIAARNNTTVDAIAKANNISNPDKIRAGSTITIPGSTTTKTNTTTTKPSTTTSKTTNKNNTVTDKTNPDYNVDTISSTATDKTLKNIEKTQPTYTQSQDVTDTYNTLQGYEANAPGPYQSSYTDQINSLLGQITGRKDFTYDMNADPLYQQYKDQYSKAGQLAMMDTLGSAAGLTGGYGSSYATTAGNQAYQANLQQLNDVIPDLYSAAYNKYRDDGTDLYNQLNAIQTQDSSDYGRYRDTVSDHYNDLNYYYNKYNDMSTADYNKYLNNIDLWEADRNYYYNKQQDIQAQNNYANEWNYGLTQDQQDQANWDKQYNYNASQDAQDQANWNKEYNYNASQDAQDQANWNKEFNYNASQDAKNAASKTTSGTNTTLKGSTTTTSPKTTTKNSSTLTYQDYNNEAMKIVQTQGKDKAESYIKNLYDTKRISADDAARLIVAIDAPFQTMTTPFSIIK